MPSFLLALLLSCTTPSAAPDKKPVLDARAKAQKVQQLKSAKAKAMKARAMKGGKGGKGKTGKSMQAPKRVGAAGPIVGELRLTPQGAGETLKTRAQLAMQWEGGQDLALLGVTAGTCTEGEPREVASGVTASWWATCEWKGMNADFAIVNSSGMIIVQRAITKDGETGEWVTVRRVPLAEGAELAPGKVTAAMGPGQGDPVPVAPAPTAAPAPAPVAPAPAPATPPTP